MSDREQLLELRGKIIRRFHHDGEAEFSDEEIKALDRLLARFPYEPGEWIYVGDTEIEADRREIKKRFLAAFDKWIICDDGPPVSPREDATAELWRYHRPIPRTIPMNVPEEIIEAARELKTGFLNSEKAAMIIKWLAREAEKGG